MFNHTHIGPKGPVTEGSSERSQRLPHKVGFQPFQRSSPQALHWSPTSTGLSHKHIPCSVPT